MLNATMPNPEPRGQPIAPESLSALPRLDAYCQFAETALGSKGK
jgi:hypothetical protein